MERVSGSWQRYRWAEADDWRVVEKITDSRPDCDTLPLSLAR